MAPKLAAIELIKQHLNKDPRAADEVRSEMVDILFMSYPPQQNLSKDDRKQIGSLAKRKDLLVLPADKGAGDGDRNTMIRSR